MSLRSARESWAEDRAPLLSRLYPSGVVTRWAGGPHPCSRSFWPITGRLNTQSFVLPVDR
ncbi:hypothetical protein chiPu_0028050, partial [Chiloscyllium punctatum]|nr:hypothetical protein [Chiloscyllium punctatum]